jgi:hypothetical protein
MLKRELALTRGTHHEPRDTVRLRTKSAARFFTGQSSEQPIVSTLAALPNVDAVHQDADEHGRGV